MKYLTDQELGKQKTAWKNYFNLSRSEIRGDVKWKGLVKIRVQEPHSMSVVLKLRIINTYFINFLTLRVSETREKGKTIFFS